MLGVDEEHWISGLPLDVEQGPSMNSSNGIESGYVHEVSSCFGCRLKMVHRQLQSLSNFIKPQRANAFEGERRCRCSRNNRSVDLLFSQFESFKRKYAVRRGGAHLGLLCCAKLCKPVPIESVS